MSSKIIKDVATDIHCSFVQNRCDETIATLASVPVSVLNSVLEEVTHLMDDPILLSLWERFYQCVDERWSSIREYGEAMPLLPVDMFSDMTLNHYLDNDSLLEIADEVYRGREDELTDDSLYRGTGCESFSESPAENELMTDFRDEDQLLSCRA